MTVGRSESFCVQWWREQVSLVQRVEQGGGGMGQNRAGMGQIEPGRGSGLAAECSNGLSTANVMQSTALFRHLPHVEGTAW